MLNKWFIDKAIGQANVWAQIHCVKSVQIRSYLWSVFSCIQSKYRKIRTRNNSAFGHFSHSDYFSKNADNKNESRIWCFIRTLKCFQFFSEKICILMWNYLHINISLDLMKKMMSWMYKITSQECLMYVQVRP